MLKRIAVLILPIMIFCIGPVYADKLVNMEMIMNVINVPHFTPTGEVNGVYFSLDNAQLHLEPHFTQYTTRRDYPNGEYEDVTTITGGYVKLLDKNEAHAIFAFRVDKWPYIRAYKLTTETGKEFLLIEKGKQFVSENDATGVWLIGKQNGKYVTYMTLPNLEAAGLVYQKIIPKIENGELRLIGAARDRDCNIWGLNDSQPPYTYKGHAVSRTEMATIADCVVSNVYLFWDDNANWFGFRYSD